MSHNNDHQYSTAQHGLEMADVRNYCIGLPSQERHEGLIECFLSVISDDIYHGLLRTSWVLNENEWAKVTFNEMKLQLTISSFDEINAEFIIVCIFY